MHKPARKPRGFSLVELLVAITIIMILAAVGYPMYTTHLLHVRRQDGQIALINLAGQMEKYAMTQHGYQDATLAKLDESEFSAEGFYQLQIVQSDAQTFVLAAIPVRAQTADKQCGTLALDSLGRKGRLQGTSVYPDKNCWQ